MKASCVSSRHEPLRWGPALCGVLSAPIPVLIVICHEAPSFSLQGPGSPRRKLRHSNVCDCKVIFQIASQIGGTVKSCKVKLMHEDHLL